MWTRQTAKDTTIPSNRVSVAYLDAKEFVIESGFGSEIDWQSEVVFEKTTEEAFLREAAWVVLSSGFRESVVRRFFPKVSSAFLDWMDAAAIARQIETCRDIALEAFANQRKIDAIATIVLRVADQGIDVVKEQIHKRGIEYLQEFPFIGPVTAFHLAKNIGAPVAKPDRHLVRVAKAAGYESPQRLCNDISESIGDSVAVVDLVIWRFATLNRDYLTTFSID